MPKEKIKNGFDDRYYLTPEGKVFDEIEQKELKISTNFKYTLRTLDGSQKKVALKTLYRLVYNKEYSIDKIENLKNEEWKEIENSEGKYFVSNLGRIKSYARLEAIILKPTITSKGYERVQLCIAENTYNFFIHRLVAAAFLPLPESINDQLHHIDLNTRNNKASNLMWLSPKDHQKFHRLLEEKKNAKLSDLSKPEKNIYLRQRTGG